MFTGLVQAVGVVRSVAPARSGSGAARIEVLLAGKGNRGVTRAWAVRTKPGDSISVSGCCLTVAEKVRRVTLSRDERRRLGTDDAGVRTGRTGRSASSRGIVLAFDVVAETLRRTTLGTPTHGGRTTKRGEDDASARVGRRVNLEPAVRAAALLGGHIVQGHVDAVARVVRVYSGAAPGEREEKGTGRSRDRAGGTRGEAAAHGEWRVRFELERTPRSRSGAARIAAGAMGCIVEKGSVCVDGVSLTVASVGGRRGREWFEVALIPTTLAETTLGELREGDRVNIETDIIARTVVAWLERMGR